MYNHIIKKQKKVNLVYGKSRTKGFEYAFLDYLFQTLTLHFVVLSFDRYSRDDVIGEVMLELEHIDLKESEQNPVPISKEITPRSFKVL